MALLTIESTRRLRRLSSPSPRQRSASPTHAAPSTYTDPYRLDRIACTYLGDADADLLTNPVTLGLRTRNPKIVALVIGSLQRLISLKVISQVRIALSSLIRSYRSSPRAMVSPKPTHLTSPSCTCICICIRNLHRPSCQRSSKTFNL